MTADIPQLRPPVISAELTRTLDEYLRFRHVVQNVYAFEFDHERVERLVQRLRPSFEMVRREPRAFMAFLEQLAQES